MAPISERIEPGSVSPRAGSAVHLTALQGERESFFVVLRAEGGRLEPGITASPLRGGQGELPPGAVRLYRVGYASLEGRRIADALIPLGLAVPPGMAPAPGENVPFLVEVAVPRGVAEGEYEGSVSLRVGGDVLRIPLRIQVLPVEIPEVASLASAFGFSAREAALGNGALPKDAALRGMGRSYSLAALDSRVTLVGGSGLAPGFHLLPDESVLRLDFSDFDLEMAPLMDGVPELEWARASALTLRVPRGLGRIRSFQYALAFRGHLAERGWLDRWIDLDDEPSLDAVQAALLAVRRVRAQSWDDCRRAPAGQERWWLVPERDPAGVSLGLGADPVGVRAIGWLAWNARIDGLRYGNVVAGFVRADRAGAPLALFYPSAAPLELDPYPVVESVRLKLLRDGLEEHALLEQVARAGMPEVADRWAGRLAPSPRAYSRMAERYDAARLALARALVQARGRASSAPPGSRPGAGAQ